MIVIETNPISVNPGHVKYIEYSYEYMEEMEDNIRGGVYGTLHAITDLTIEELKRINNLSIGPMGRLKEDEEYIKRLLDVHFNLVAKDIHDGGDPYVEEIATIYREDGSAPLSTLSSLISFDYE